MKVYVTKYALTQGVFACEAEATHSPSIVTCGRAAYHGEGRDWHRTWESALARAEKMRTERLRSLKASIAKLEKTAFTEPLEMLKESTS